MTGTECSREGRVLVAVDVAKHEHVVAIEFADKTTKRLRVKNRRSDLEGLDQILQPHKQEVQFGLEPTCSYHRNISYFFKSRGYDVRGISTLVLARTREALHNSWDKNDPKDTDVILYLLRQGLVQTLIEPAIEGHNHLQELSKTHAQIVQRKSKIQHSILNHYLPIYFPEGHVFFRGSKTRWFSRVLKHFPVPSTVTKYSFDEFLALASPIVGRVAFKHSLIKDFYDLALKSIGLPAEETSYEVKMFRYAVEEHDRLTQKLLDLELEIERILGEELDYKILKSIPGVGPLIAMTILAEAGNLRRFKHEKQFLKYCGLNLSTEQSGMHRGSSKLSKRGNSRMRCVLWQAARAAINTKNENSIKQKFDRYVKASPKNADLKRKARTACAAKVARMAFGLIKKSEMYRSHLDRTPQADEPMGNRC